MKNDIQLKQKSFNNLKKKFQRVLVGRGGQFQDTRGRGGSVVSIYTCNGHQVKFKWHSSYSDVRAIRNVSNRLMKIAKTLEVYDSKD